MVIDGPRLSILKPVTGPAVEQLAALSQIWRVFVDALAVSVPAATVVTSTKDAGEPVAKPEPLSDAVHWTSWSSGNHESGADEHATVGGVASGGSLTVIVTDADDDVPPFPSD